MKIHQFSLDSFKEIYDQGSLAFVATVCLGKQCDVKCNDKKKTGVNKLKKEVNGGSKKEIGNNGKNKKEGNSNSVKVNNNRNINRNSNNSAVNVISSDNKKQKHVLKSNTSHRLVKQQDVSHIDQLIKNFQLEMNPLGASKKNTEAGIEDICKQPSSRSGL